MRYAWLLIWPVLALALALAMQDDVSRYIRLVRTGTVVTATVTGADCSDHGSVYYSYAWSGVTYRSGDIDGRICDSARAGDRLDIWIVPDDPRVDATSEPRAGLLNDLIFIFLATGLVAWGLNAVFRQQNTARLPDHP